MKLFGRPLYGYRQKVRLFVVVMRDRYSYRGSRAIYRAAAEIGEQWKTGRNVYLFTLKKGGMAAIDPSTSWEKDTTTRLPVVFTNFDK